MTEPRNEPDVCIRNCTKYWLHTNSVCLSLTKCSGNQLCFCDWGPIIHCVSTSGVWPFSCRNGCILWYICSVMATQGSTFTQMLQQVSLQTTCVTIKILRKHWNWHCWCHVCHTRVYHGSMVSTVLHGTLVLLLCCLYNLHYYSRLWNTIRTSLTSKEPLYTLISWTQR